MSGINEKALEKQVEKEGLQLGAVFVLTFLGTFAADAKDLVGVGNMHDAKAIVVAAGTAAVVTAVAAVRPKLKAAYQRLVAAAGGPTPPTPPAQAVAPAPSA